MHHSPKAKQHGRNAGCVFRVDVQGVSLSENTDDAMNGMSA
jgi:hypothetical protein